MDRIKTWALPGAILIAGLAVAAALLLGNRYSSIQVSNVLWVTDRLTGHVTQCDYPTRLDRGGVSACVDLRPIRGPTNAAVELKPAPAATLDKAPANGGWTVVGIEEPAPTGDLPPQK